MYKNQGNWRGCKSIPFMRWKICLATFMAVMIVERPSSRKTTSLKERRCQTDLFQRKQKRNAYRSTASSVGGTFNRDTAVGLL